MPVRFAVDLGEATVEAVLGTIESFVLIQCHDDDVEAELAYPILNCGAHVCIYEIRQLTGPEVGALVFQVAHDEHAIQEIEI